MTFISKIAIAATALTLGSALVAQAADDDWDVDADGLVSETEFGDGLRTKGAFAEWDTNADGSVDEEEFAAGNFKRYDRDESGDIDTAEREDMDRDWESED